MTSRNADSTSRSWFEPFNALSGMGYAVQDARFVTGRPDRGTYPVLTPEGRPAVAKFYPKGNGHQAFENMQQLWQSPFGKERRPPGLPEPIAYLPELGIVITERLEGRPLAEMPHLERPLLLESLRLLADLHRCAIVPPTVRTAAKLIRSIRRKAARIAELTPEYADAVLPLVQAFEKVNSRSTEPVPCHGDFSPRNVLAEDGRVALIDWDRLQWASPARDIAYFGAWCWVLDLRQGRNENWRILQEAVLIYRDLRPEASLDSNLGFHIAAALTRIACSIVELWPEDKAIVPSLIAEAEKHLQ